VAGVLCQIAVNLVKERFRIDDTLDVFAVHGVGGIFGTIMAPLLAVGTLSDGQGLATQFIALAAVGVFTVVVTVILVKATQLVYPIRVPEEEEFDGLDITSHGERAYEMTS
jgi:Amt family ammonium transporter